MRRGRVARRGGRRCQGLQNTWLSWGRPAGQGGKNIQSQVQELGQLGKEEGGQDRRGLWWRGTLYPQHRPHQLVGCSYSLLQGPGRGQVGRMGELEQN